MESSHWRPVTKIGIAIIILHNHVWQLSYWARRPLLPLSFSRVVHFRFYPPTACFSSSSREMKFGTKIKACHCLDPRFIWYLTWISHGRMICTANGGLFILIITCWKGSLRYIWSLAALTTQLMLSFQSRTTSHGWTTKDEQEFTVMLEKELDKVHDFQKAKVWSFLPTQRSNFPFNSLVGGF